MSFKKLHFKVVSFDASADWKKIVYVSIVLFIFSIAWSGYLFWTIESGKAFVQTSDGSTGPRPKLNTESLQKVADLYDKKAKLLNLLLTKTPAVVDPAK